MMMAKFRQEIFKASALKKTPIIEYDKYALFSEEEKRIFISFRAFLPSLKHEWKTEGTLLPHEYMAKLVRLN